MAKYLVTASWTVEAVNGESAINLIENAVAKDGSVNADLEDSDASPVDGEGFIDSDAWNKARTGE